MGRRFGPDNAWGLRVNGSCRNGDTNIDDGKQEFGLMALALDYRSTQLRWSVDAYAQKEETDIFRAQTGFRPGIAFIPKAPSGRRAVYDGADLALRDATIASRLEYDLSPDLMLYAAAGYHYGASEQDFPSARGMDPGRSRCALSRHDHGKTGNVARQRRERVKQELAHGAAVGAV